MGLDQLKIEDLLAFCDACSGEGYIYSTVIKEDEDDECWNGQEECPACHGRGKLLTPAGKVLALFVKELRKLPDSTRIDWPVLRSAFVSKASS